MPGTEQAGFDAFRDCSGALAAWPTRAHCDILDAGTDATADWQADVPTGWTCAMTSDRSDRHPEAPAWWLYTRPPPDDVTQAVVQTRLQVAFAYDVSTFGSGPVDGAVQMFSHDGPIWRWNDAGPRGFVIIGEVGAQDEIEIDGVVTDVIKPGPSPDPEPSAHWNATYASRSTFNATNVSAEFVGTAWGRHSSSAGWYPHLYATQVVRLADGLRYLPSFEFPIHGGPDPKTQAGSGHWSTNLHVHAGWTDETEGNSTLRLNQAILLRFDLHLTSVGAGSCEACPAFMDDPAGFVTCTLRPP